jgi:hypothetical protein
MKHCRCSRGPVSSTDQGGGKRRGSGMTRENGDGPARLRGDQNLGQGRHCPCVRSTAGIPALSFDCPNGRRLIGKFGEAQSRQIVRLGLSHSPMYLARCSRARKRQVTPPRSDLPRSAPKVPEPCGRQLGVTYRVLDRPVPEPVLNGAGVMAGVGQGVAAAVPQHVGVDGEIEAGARADALDQSIGGVRRE